MGTRHQLTGGTHSMLPVVKAAVDRDCPAGFRFERQLNHVKGMDTIRKKAEVEHGKGNVVVLRGHYGMYPKGGGGGLTLDFRDTGCRVYVRLRKKRLLIPGTTQEAGEPDWTRFCSICEAPPVEPTTGKCGRCLFGDFKHANGNW